MAPHDLVEWVYTLLPAVLLLAGSVWVFIAWRMRRRRQQQHQADPERLLRDRRRQGEISKHEYAHRLRSFGGASASDDVGCDTTDALEQNSVRAKLDSRREVPPRG